MTDFPQSGNSSNSPAFAAALQRAQLIASKIRPDADGTAAPPQLAGTKLIVICHVCLLNFFIQISLIFQFWVVSARKTKRFVTLTSV